MNLSDQSFLITGAAGFIGSHLGNRLTEAGTRVYGLDNYLHPVGAPPSFKIDRADVREPEFVAVRARGCDAIVHLAAAINIDWARAFPEIAWDINVNGTIAVLEACRRLDIPIVYASSSEVYGSAQERLMSETHPLDGQSVYSASKIAADRLCRAYAIEQGLDVRVVRLFNTFGPYQGEDSYGGVIAKFTRLATEGKPMPIYGDGTQRRDYLWIDDAVSAYTLALTQKFDGPMNFGTGTTVSVLEIAEKIGWAIAGEDGKRGWSKTWWEFMPSRKAEVQCLRADWGKAQKMGWIPKTPFAQGLQQYVEWMKTERQT